MLLAVLCLGCLACSKPGAASFKYQDFQNSKAGLVLGFDLRNDKEITGGLVVNTVQTSASGTRLVVLPFDSQAFDLPGALLATTGRHANHTVLAYFPATDQRSIYGIGFLPNLPAVPVGRDIADLLPGVYFTRTGLGRTFIYRFGTAHDQATDLVGSNRGLKAEAPELIGVALPGDAKKLEMLPGRIAVGEETATARFYPNPGSTGGTIQIQYEVRASRQQDQIAEWAPKYLSVILAPLLALLFLPAKDTGNPRLRRWGIWILSTLAALVFASFAWAVGSADEISWSPIVGLLLSVLGGAATIFVLVQKK